MTCCTSSPGEVGCLCFYIYGYVSICMWQRISWKSYLQIWVHGHAWEAETLGAVRAAYWMSNRLAKRLSSHPGEEDSMGSQLESQEQPLSQRSIIKTYKTHLALPLSAASLQMEQTPFLSLYNLFYWNIVGMLRLDICILLYCIVVLYWLLNVFVLCVLP